MTKRWFMGLILGCLLLSVPLRAQTFEDGYQSYVRNQFPVAELQFKSALKRTNADEEKSFILKFIGICQYMRGDKKNAQQSFTQALSLDRNVQIDADEVLDPSVVTFFNAIKAQMGPEVKKQAKEKAQPLAKAPPPQFAPAKTAPAKGKAKIAKKKARESDKDSIMNLDSNITVEDRSHRSSYMQFLPFGLPQFHNDSYWLGGAVAAGQVLALYSVLDANNTLSERHRLSRIVQNKEGLTEEQRQDFFDANRKFITKVNTSKNLALGAFAGLWAASVLESFWHRQPSKGRADNQPTPPKQSLQPIVEADRNGGTFGLSWQTQLK